MNEVSKKIEEILDVKLKEDIKCPICGNEHLIVRDYSYNKYTNTAWANISIDCKNCNISTSLKTRTDVYIKS